MPDYVNDGAGRANDVMFENVDTSELSLVRIDGKSQTPGALVKGERSDDFFRVHFYVRNEDMERLGVDMSNNKGKSGFTRVSLRVWTWQVVPGSDATHRNVRLLDADRTYNVGIPHYDDEGKAVLNEKGKMTYLQVPIRAGDIADMYAAVKANAAASK